MLVMTLPFRAWHASAEEARWVGLVHQFVVIALLLHVAYLAVRDFNGDLVAARRRFRWTVVTLIPLMAITIVLVETGLLGIAINDDVLLLQAITLFLLVGLFAHWMLRPREDLFAASQSQLTSAVHVNNDLAVNQGRTQ